MKMNKTFFHVSTLLEKIKISCKTVENFFSTLKNKIFNMSRYMKKFFHLACYMKSSTGLDNYCVFFLGWVKKKIHYFYAETSEIIFSSRENYVFLVRIQVKTKVIERKKNSNSFS